MIGGEYMKILRIYNGKGEYSVDGNDFNPIDEMSKEDIFQIVELIIKNENVVFDEISDSKKINNVAQSIVYSSLIDKLKDLKDKRQSIIAAVKEEFKEAVKKYSN